MKYLQQPEAIIKMPFIPLTLDGGQVCIIGSRPSAGRTLYTLHLIEENTIKDKDYRCLVYFISNSKKRTVKGSGFGAMLSTNENINLNWVNFGRGDQFIFDIKKDVKEFKPDYIVIDGFEKLFKLYEEDDVLIKEVDVLLADIRMLSDEKGIPIVVTTHMLLSSEKRGVPSKPLLCDFGSNVLEITADHILSLRNPFYKCDTERTEGESLFKTMEIYQLKPWSFAMKPTEFLFDEQTGRFSPKPIA